MGDFITPDNSSICFVIYSVKFFLEDLDSFVSFVSFENFV